jgi:hypothetical protein
MSSYRTEYVDEMLDALDQQLRGMRKRTTNEALYLIADLMVCVKVIHDILFEMNRNAKHTRQ